MSDPLFFLIGFCGGFIVGFAACFVKALAAVAATIQGNK